MGTDLSVDQPVELWQLSLEGRRQHCRICNRPVLGLFGQDQAVSEGMMMGAAGLSPQIDVGWFHTRCVIDSGIGPELFEMRARTSEQRESRSRGEYHAAFHDWLGEVAICDRSGRIWDLTLDTLRNAARVDGGWLLSVEHDVNLLIIGPKTAHTQLLVRGVGREICLKDILSQLDVLDRLDHPFSIEAGVFEPSRRSTDSALTGRLKYQMFLPDDAARLVRSRS